MSNAQIGNEMGISAATVAVHLDGAKLKLGVFSKKEVVEVARARGLV
jgi:DNA-binding CsgD family transcriptional regulator